MTWFTVWHFPSLPGQREMLLLRPSLGRLRASSPAPCGEMRNTTCQAVGGSCRPSDPTPSRPGWSILLLPRAGAGTSLGSRRLPCEDPGEKQDPSPFSKGRRKVGWLFPSSQGKNNCKSFGSELHESGGWCSPPGAGHPPQQSQEPVDPNLGNAPHLTGDLWTHPSPGPAGSRALPLLPPLVCVF